MRRAALLIGAALLASPALAQEGGQIRTGEHGTFSRVVMTIEPTTEWSLETTDGVATIFFPGKALDFGTAGVFERMPRDRVRAVRSFAGRGGTTVEVALGCDCRVSASFVGARYLALDVSDRGAQTADALPQGETPEERALRERDAVASAEQILLQQIERAAGQGLVVIAPPETGGPLRPRTDRVIATRRPAASVPAPAEPVASAARPSEADPENVFDHRQVIATTVFDRDTRSAQAAAAAQTPASCLADGAFDVADWSNGTSLHGQAAELLVQSAERRDASDLEAVGKLARLHIRFGFGAEAESIVTGAGPALEDAPLLLDLARAVERRPLAAGGPLSVADRCPGRHGLWLAIAGVGPAFHDEAHFTTVNAAFGDLPVDMRDLMGPVLIERLIDAGHPAEARRIHDTMTRAAGRPSVERQLAEARLIAAEGRVAEAIRMLNALVDGNAHNAADALRHLVRLGLDARLNLPTAIVTELGAAALENRYGPRESPLRQLYAEALAAGGDLPAGIDELLRLRADIPGAAQEIGALAARMLARATPDETGAAVYAEAALRVSGLMARDRGSDDARGVIANNLLGVGLANAALEVLRPAARRGDEAARLLSAEAQLRLGSGRTARRSLANLDGEEAARLRARAFALDGDYRSADRTIAATSEAPDAYAWPAGNWMQVRASDPTPERLAMAGYMAQREGVEGAAAAADPFERPLPALATPSLRSARELLETGPTVDRFIKNLLDEAPWAD